MSKLKNNEYLDFDDYFNNETKVSKEDKAIIELETLLIGKMIEIREKKEEISGKEYTNFSSDKKLIGYIERQIEKIGEAINQIQKLDKDILLQINNNKSY